MRISRHQMFMQIAHVVAQRSTCFRLNVGAIIVSDNQVRAIGYNGAPSKADHCTGHMCEGAAFCERTVHAEVNALSRYVPDDPLDQWEMYCTHSPCDICASYLLRSGRISALFFANEYRITQGLTRMEGEGVPTYRVTPAGYVTRWATGEAVELGA